MKDITSSTAEGHANIPSADDTVRHASAGGDESLVDTTGSPEVPVDTTGTRVVIPVAAETLTVGRRIVETGRGVRVVKTVAEHEAVVDEPLGLDEVQVERTTLNRWLSEEEDLPSVRQEGDVTVVPVLEEVLVTTKRLRLREEIRITRVRREVHQPQRVVLREEQVSVEHFDEKEDATGPAGRKD
jgi:stress response protein YsnF